MIHDDRSTRGGRVAVPVASPRAEARDWRRKLPVLSDGRIRLRELSGSDAQSLLGVLVDDEVSNLISPPPTTVADIERFVEWTRRERAAGRQFCFGIVPAGCRSAVGLIQVRQLEPRFEIAEWGFVLGFRYWGTGVFMSSAELILNFAFQHVGVHRLEARAAVQNVRGNGALRKLGAVQEGLLRGSLRREGRLFDQYLWSILVEDRVRSKAVWGALVH